jgi:hypothetical protein
VREQNSQRPFARLGRRRHARRSNLAASLVAPFLLCVAVWAPAVFGPPARAQQRTASATAGEPPPPSQILKKGIAENNYLAALLDLREREAEYLASRRRKNQYFDYMALISSFVGDYDALYRYEEKFLELLEPVNKARAQFAEELTNSPIDAYQPRDALAAINALADKHQVLMINEEHRTPLHRAFTLRLLPILYAKGFRYLALETVNTTDTELNRRGYPTQATGTYASDPVYGDMIRRALKLGFKVVPYDVDNLNCTPPPDNPVACDDERERGQARNIVDRILKNDPGAKVLVHAGRDHISETKEEGFAMMAWHFRDISHIDPLTIDQMHMSERRNPADEEPLYRYATRKWQLTEPTVFQSAGGELWSGGAGHDLKVFHPRSRYENGRPTWLRLGGLRRPQPIGFGKLKLPARQRQFLGQEPLLVQAFVAGESADAVPVDQVVIYPTKQAPVLMLPKGKVRVRAIDRAGRVLGHYETALK